MDIQKFNSFIPLEMGDIIKIKEYANTYELENILVVHSLKDNKTIHLLKLKDVVGEEYTGAEVTLPYESFNWEIVTINKDRKDNIDEQ